MPGGVETVSGCVPDGVVEHLALSGGLVIVLVNSSCCCLMGGLEVEG